MYHVLLPVDDSEERVEAQARAVAALPHPDEITVTLLHVFEDWDESEDVPDLPTAGVVEDVLSESRIESKRAFGDPSEKIIETARDADVDAIVLGGRKRSSLGSLLFGSVSHSVTLHADRPVMITGDTVKAEDVNKPPGYAGAE